MLGTVLMLVCGAVLTSGLPQVEVRHKSTVSKEEYPVESGRQDGTDLGFQHSHRSVLEPS